MSDSLRTAQCCQCYTYSFQAYTGALEGLKEPLDHLLLNIKAGSLKFVNAPV